MSATGESLDSAKGSGRGSSILRWLKCFPSGSLQRLIRINKAANSAHHVVLALSYGLFDSRIRGLNKMIVALLLKREKARKDCRHEIVDSIECVLQDLHFAIDIVTYGQLEAIRLMSTRPGVCNKPTSRASATTL